MNSLFLIGYMGCGKSSLGRKIARRLDMPFYDTDMLVEERAGAVIADIFQYEGEERFRCLEREVLETLLTEEPCVVSTGGGLPIWGDNMECMNRVGATVFLLRPPEQIICRLTPYGRQKRPRFRGLDDENLLEFMIRNMAEREPYYRSATWTVDCTDVSDNVLVEQIVNQFKTLCDHE